VYVVLKGIMGNTVTEYTAKITGNYQNGFRKKTGEQLIIHIY